MPLGLECAVLLLSLNVDQSYRTIAPTFRTQDFQVSVVAAAINVSDEFKEIGERLTNVDVVALRNSITWELTVSINQSHVHLMISS